mgnify:CR=1 FL=1
MAGDPERLARFRREAKVLASLNHPGIGAIYGLEEVAGHQYLILEYVEGETLAERRARGAIPVEEALTLARQIAEALATKFFQDAAAQPPRGARTSRGSACRRRR